MNNGFVFYRSFADAVEGLESDQFKELIMAVIRYALDGVEPAELSPVLRGYFVLMKPQIDANNARRESGKKGGKASKSEAIESNPEANASNTEANESKEEANESKPEAKEKVKVKDKVKDKDKEKDIEKEKPAPKHKHGKFARVLLTDDELQQLEKDYGADNALAAVDYLDEYIERKGYTAKSHYLAIKRWVFDALRENEIKKKELDQREQRLKPQDKPKEGITRNNDLDAWLMEQVRSKV